MATATATAVKDNTIVKITENATTAYVNDNPVTLDVPANILVQNENMATSLAVLSMHLQAQIKEKK